MENLAQALNWHWSHLLIIPGVLTAYTVHGLAYALVAYFLGDNSQVEQENINLNPLRHLSWFGSIAFILTGFIGFPKPIRVDPRYFKDRSLDTLLVAVAGPAANLLFSLLVFLASVVVAAFLAGSSPASWSQVFALFVLDRTEPPASLTFQAWVQAFTGQVWLANFALAAISLIPLPSFAGFAALMSLIALLRERRKGLPPAPDEIAARSRLAPEIPQAGRSTNVAAIHFEKGVEYHTQGKFDDAIARYRQAIRVDRHFGPAYINLGRAYLGKGRRKEALQAFRGATHLASDEKSQVQALAHLRDLSEISPFNPDTEKKALNEQGAIPWTDTRPSPDWLSLGVGAVFILAFLACLYGYLFIGLANRL